MAVVTPLPTDPANSTTDAAPRCPRHPKYTGARMYHRHVSGLRGNGLEDCAGCDEVYAARHSGGWREIRTRKIKIEPFERPIWYSYDDQGPSYITSPGT